MRCHAQFSKTCEPEASWRISNTRNSMGAAMATPIWQINCPWSMTLCGLLVSSHLTKKASAGLAPLRPPLGPDFLQQDIQRVAERAAQRAIVALENRPAA